MKIFITGLLMILLVVLLMASGSYELQMIGLMIFATSCGLLLALVVVKIVEEIKEKIKK